jgi:DNA-binding CsgD family transcriptional regulator
MSTGLSDVDVPALLRLAGEVSEVGNDVHLRRAHILDGLLGLVGGCAAVCSELEPGGDGASAWAVPGSVTCAGALGGELRAMIERYVTGQLAALDPCIPPLLRDEKPVATVRRAQLIDDSQWQRSDHFNLIRRPLRFGESIYAKLTTPAGRHLKLSFHREMGDSAFSDRDARFIHLFNENLAGLYVGVPAAQATTPRSPNEDLIETLPPRLRPVLGRLLAGDAEKQAALKLGLSPHTVHEYTKVLYRTFSVNSRGELLAKFVVSA